MEYDNTNSGAVFAKRPDQIKTPGKSPTLGGSLNVADRDFWVNGWSSKEKGQVNLMLTAKNDESIKGKIGLRRVEGRGYDYEGELDIGAPLNRHWRVTAKRINTPKVHKGRFLKIEVQEEIGAETNEPAVQVDEDAPF